MTWLYMSLASGFFVATKNIVTRKLVFHTDKDVILYAKYCFVCLFCLILLLSTGIPKVDREFYGYAFVGAVIDVFAAWCFLNAVASAQLAKTFPLIAFSPIFLLGTSFVILGEVPSKQGIIGIVLIVCGAYLLGVERLQGGGAKPLKGLWREKGSRYMLLAALLFSLLAPIFKKAILHSSPSFALFATQLLSTIFLTVHYIRKKRINKLSKQIAGHFNLLLAAGLATFLACITFFSAFQLGLTSYVVSVKRTSILMTILLGYIFLKEDHLFKSLVVGCIMLLGICLISLG
jgi:uncharacterized membrane protein